MQPSARRIEAPAIVTFNQSVLNESLADCSTAAEMISSPTGFKVTIKAITIVIHGHRRIDRTWQQPKPAFPLAPRYSA